eukprot:jgi/Mesvir1/14104/Mv20239-RA.1
MTLGIISINCPVAKSLPYAGVYRPAMAKAHYCEVDLDTGEYGKLSALHSFRFKVPLNSRPTDDDVRAVNMLFAILRGNYPRDHITIVEFDDHSTRYGTVYIVTSDDSNGPVPYNDFKAHRTVLDFELRQSQMEDGGVVYEFP